MTSRWRCSARLRRALAERRAPSAEPASTSRTFRLTQTGRRSPSASPSQSTGADLLPHRRVRSLPRRQMRAAMAEAGDEYKVASTTSLLKTTATAPPRPRGERALARRLDPSLQSAADPPAVAIPDGLITPVTLDADQKGDEDRPRVTRARGASADRSSPPRSTWARPLGVEPRHVRDRPLAATIKPPEAGILAVGAVSDVPVVRSGAIAIEKHSRVTMSCDHRVIDGATGAKSWARRDRCWRTRCG